MDLSSVPVVSTPSSAVNEDKKFYGPHHPLLVNDNVILFETLLTTGQILPMHNHPKPHLRYTFTPGVQKHTWQDGSTEIQEDKVGEYEWRESLEHQVENVGQADIHSLVFEFNTHKVFFHVASCFTCFMFPSIRQK